MVLKLNSFFKIAKGTFTFDSLTLYATPGTNWTLNFTNKLITRFYDNFMSPNLYENDAIGNYEFYMNISIRTCFRGEIYDGAINT